MAKKTAEKKFYFNTLDIPVVMDDEGHVLGGGEFGYFPLSEQIASAMDRGDIRETQPEPVVE